MTKKEKFEKLVNEPGKCDFTLFTPILMHFAARFNNNTYGNFASDNRVLVESNIKAMDYFGMDMVGLISDPYCETAAFGAEIEFTSESVPKCKNHVILSNEDIVKLIQPDIYISHNGQITEYRAPVIIKQY